MSTWETNPTFALFRACGQAVEETILAHEERCPLRAQLARLTSAARHRHITAIPFADARIPDATLARMLETLATEPDADTASLAERYGYPAPLVERELPIYHARYRHWISAQVAARG